MLVCPALAQESSTIRVDGGSGVIVRFEPKTKKAFALTAGHVILDIEAHRGTKYYTQHKENISISIFYRNSTRLAKPVELNANILCAVWQNNIWDIGVIEFTSPHEIDAVNLVREDFKFEPLRFDEDVFLKNIGCEFTGILPAKPQVFTVRYLYKQYRSDTSEFVCIDNAAKAGRSGGGLFCDDKLVAITSRANNRYTHYSSPEQIWQFLRKQSLLSIIEN